MFAFLSGLIIAWQYIDIRIPEVATVPIIDQTIAIGHPEVMPVVLFAALIYFGIRTTIEWRMCTAKCRSRLAAKSDFALSVGLAILATFVFSYQSLASQRLAEKIDASDVLIFATTFLAPILNLLLVLLSKRNMNRVIRAGRELHRFEVVNYVIMMPTALVGTTLLYVAVIWTSPVSVWPKVFGGLINAIGISIACVIVYQLRKRIPELSKYL